MFNVGASVGYEDHQLPDRCDNPQIQQVMPGHGLITNYRLAYGHRMASDIRHIMLPLRKSDPRIDRSHESGL